MSRGVLLLPLLVGACATSGAKRLAALPPSTLTVVALGAEARAAAGEAASPELRIGIKDGEAELQSRAASSPESAAGARKAAREAMARAREDYRRLRFAEAISTLGRAETGLAGAARVPDDFATLQQLAVQRGLSLLALGREDEARQAFATALALGYGGPEPGQYPPDVEASIRRIQDQLAGAARVGLTIKAQPAGCRLWIDGREQGESPVTLELAPGLHHVRAENPGHEARSFFHRLSPGRSDRLEIYLRPLSDGALAADLLERHRAGQPLVELPAPLLGRAFGVGLALLEVQAGRARLRWTGKRAGPLRPCDGPTAQRVECLRSQLRALGGRREPTAPRAGPSPLHRRWWFWALVGGGAAAATGAGIGIYYGTRDTGGTDVDIVTAR